MDGIYIIDDKLNIDIQKLTYPKIEYSKKREASDFHEYVINLFKIYPTIQKLNLTCLKGLDINPLSKISIRLPLGQGGVKLEHLQGRQ